MLQLKKFPDIPVSTQEEARESLPHSEEPRFRLVARDEGSFPCLLWKEFPAFPSHLKRRRSPQERREELQGRATIPRVPQMSQSIPEEPVFPALPRVSRRGSTHTTVARATALWESLVGKPRGKATDPLIYAMGSVNCCYRWGGKRKCMPPHETRTESPGETPEVPQDPCQLWRGKPHFPSPTPHKVLGPGIGRRGIPRGPLATRMGSALSCGHQSGSLRFPS